jgi:hypothetical protein
LSFYALSSTLFSFMLFCRRYCHTVSTACPLPSIFSGNLIHACVTCMLKVLIKEGKKVIKGINKKDTQESFVLT